MLSVSKRQEGVGLHAYTVRL